MSALRVGVIGANAKTGWARESHIPAIQALAGLELAAVATSTPETAAQAEKAFGVRSYSDGLELANSPDIDIVTVATRVPDHREMILAALASGKHVYSEWPLGRGYDETKELHLAAEAANRKTAIGLQLRGSPTVKRAKELLDGGAIGRLLSANVYSSTAGFGPIVPEPYLYLEDPDNFANLITIQGGHTLDLIFTLFGEAIVFNSLPSRQYPAIEAGQDRLIRSRTTYDHLLFQCLTGDGVSVSLEVAGGRSPEAPLRLEIVGEKGVLSLNGGAARGFQADRLSLLLNKQEQHIDDGELKDFPASAVNVGGIYAALRDDITKSSSTVAGFSEALVLTKRVEAVLAAGGFTD
ncbi:putative dehydrogenase [Rhizobium sp. ERR 922]|uniref:Gfo/Idh/MocA family protein n=1 Tax=unclassified Rhizobium TaxID=2613769 RepID=UPI00119D1D14|nr:MULTISPECIES: Gfo/Idh/MocA family oxidoreductase [unclassified Rhizobium]TWB46409.1 putative dehydrogenase [Rhizobium sp. ERR 922]TWB88776.1 putative dehydrogenase [Rhizobium sp. ERR 942]